MKIIYSTLFAILLIFSSGSCTKQHDQIRIVDIPDVNQTNTHYVSNLSPLQPSVFIKLPVGAVKPGGWLKEYFERQSDGLTGKLGEISAWLQKDDNAWLAENGQGKWGWEEVPYWLKGYANIGYILEDQKMIDEAKIWIEGAFKSQQPNGDFGPQRFIGKEKSRDFWGNMIMLYCLQSYYEYSKDIRVIELMTKYFKYQLSIPEEKFLTHYWQRIRGGDNLHSVIWLYNRTGETWLLELAEKIHQNTAPWSERGQSIDDIGGRKNIREGTEWPGWYGDLPDWHNVNIAQAFREPAQYYLISGKDEDLKASYENHNIVRKYFGQVPGGMYGSDESCRPGYDDPRQGIETCGMVEQMNSDEHMLRITGDVFWADHAEEVAFNSYPAALTSDFKSLRYLTSPNMVLNDSEGHHPGIENTGPFLMFNPFSSRCCQHNHAQGWPYFNENLWMATPDNGLAAVIYAASTVKAKVGAGAEVTIKNTSNYPYEDNLNFEIGLTEMSTFPLYFRIPHWAENASLSLNNEKIEVKTEAGKYVKILREWKDGDKVELILPKKLKVRTWENNHNSVSVDYGPLTFSLKIEENYIRKSSKETAIGASRWPEGVDAEQWPSWEVQASSAWNYGLVYNPDKLSESFKIVKREWPENNFPFTPEDNPISIIAKGAKIPQWQLDEHKLCGELMDSPVATLESIEEIELIPMGAARLRISSFPVIGESQNAIEWK